MQTPNYSLVAVFEAIADSEKITRREIAEITGFSQVTVGKAVDALSDAGVIIRNKKEADGVGRKGDICILNKNHGMLLFDMSEEKIRMCVCDIGFDILFEAVSDELSELVMMGLSKTAEFSFESVPRIGCICKKGEKKNTEKAFINTIGNAPDIICPISHANAYANHRRFGYRNEIFARIFADGHGWGTIMREGEIYLGSHGKAGIFSRGETAENFVCRIADLGEALDVDLIHISCDGEKRDELAAVLHSFFAKFEIKPELTVESAAACPDIISGLALAMRNEFLISLMSK